MTRLCLIRDTLKKFFTRNEKLIMPAAKFIVGILAMYVMTLNLSYMSALNQWWIILAVSIVCTVLPWSGITVLVSGYILINFYAVSWEVMAVMACIYLIMLCSYYIFQPKNGILIVLVPIFLWLKLPLLPAIIVAVISSPAGAIPIIYGTVVYHIMMVVRNNTTALAITEDMNTSQKFTFLLSRIFGNSEMWLICAVMVLTLCVVYFIKMRRASYSRELAVVIGSVLGIVVYLSGTILLNIPVDIPVLIAGGFLSMLIGVIASFADVALDYSRTEYVQFEDDDYYYYVKAVPKISVTKPEFTVKRFDNKENEENQDVPEDAEINNEKGL